METVLLEELWWHVSVIKDRATKTKTESGFGGGKPWSILIFKNERRSFRPAYLTLPVPSRWFDFKTFSKLGLNKEPV